VPVKPFVALLLLAGLACGCQGVGWQHAHGLDHPLTGRIADLRSQQLVGEEALLDAIEEADIVLLGEAHGNRDHHRLQARLVDAIGGTLQGVVFEQIPLDRQQAVVEHLAGHPGDTQGLGTAIDWAESGWPDWALYEPIARAAVDRDALIVAGNLSRQAVDQLVQGGELPLDQLLVERSGLARPLDPNLESGLLKRLEEAHCGMLPVDALPAMLSVQRSRDALMADRLATIRGRGKAALIAGAEHVRKDWGVPLYLASIAPEARVLSIAFIEVGDELAGPPFDLPYDFVWFTPRKNPIGFDPCDAYRQQLNQLEAHRSASPPRA
jgi:uncharacterized iron-regulated protein